MGKGDRKTKRGKIIKGSYGVRRRRYNKKVITRPAPKQASDVTEAAAAKEEAKTSSLSSQTAKASSGAKRETKTTAKSTAKTGAKTPVKKKVKESSKDNKKPAGTTDTKEE